MGMMTEIVAACMARQRGLAEKMLKDIRPEQFAILASPGGVQVESNHPAFVYAHLGLYPARVLTFMGQDVSKLQAPAGLELCKAGEPCKHDPEGTIYPKMSVIVDHFFKSHDLVMNLLPGIDDSVFSQDMQDERARQYFPKVGMGVTFMMTSHIMNHLGQVSAWRRMMGLPGAM